jgi:sirohydrochlorin cobaltochelatase
METPKQAVILIGHGGLPNDIPKEVVEDFMKIHKQRIRRGTPINSEEKDLETTIRNWERTPESDPYKVGLEKLADQLAEENITKVILITTMITPGGSHSEREIPEEVEALRLKYPKMDFQYAWPNDLDLFSNLLSDHIINFLKKPTI